ncbi:amino acid ABC transporter permease [Rhodococcus sp. HM1]|uniref:amino acid ABC transporter permease n=1 Tax=unclassified Rhodococcus (in: high G+C Gram-positive bacteria) TaxID=192944 RepID=UPI0018CF7D7B|nr:MULTISPECIES: amino acid ABC transporter permease [unclassified Rhodococcus (in: high G+C Gram-positive bacteria)]MBH0119179.1 amino acid ABC transporter permease [Rhodococcus sp. CX]MCK8672416.1 amino acid ABC transporter permease [Rhodococcus sp. HM1]
MSDSNGWDQFGDLVGGIPLTLELTVASFAIGAVVGVPLVLARRSQFRLTRGLAVMIIDLARGIPMITWLFLIYFALPQAGIRFSQFAAAVLGLGLLTAAMMAEIYRAGIAAVPKGQWEAGRTLGLSERRLFLDVAVPQAARVAIPPTATLLIGLLKDTAIASTLGVAEITYRAQIAAQNTYKGLTIFALAAGLYIVLSLPVAALSRWLDRWLHQKWTVA